MQNIRNLSTIRRINVLTRILSARNGIQLNLVRALNIDGKIKIGDVEREVNDPKNPEYVPQNYIRVNDKGNLELSQTALHHLRWMLQKDNLGQDMFLLGRPGPLRRSIAMQYLELTQREAEYVSLSRDTTESDLKQRREIQNGTAVYFDQSAVRAATEGRVLVIEGVEKAERNVLPVLNNLLENREMHLEDGRFLIPAERYDKLLKQFGPQDLVRWGLVRVSENFRVIALGLPVPKYRGAPLDPPLRSRFQARDVSGLSYQENFNELREIAPNAKGDALTQLLTFSTSIQTSDESKTNLPDFPVEGLKNLAHILENNKHASIHDVIYRCYPYQMLIAPENIEIISSLFKSLNISTESKRSRIISVEKVTDTESVCTIEVGNKQTKFNVPSGRNRKNQQLEEFVPIEYHSNVIADLLQSYAVGDFCVIGPKGSGKSALIFEMSRILDQTFEPMVLYQDMTARDLIQQRTTKINGDTIWRDSPLVRAAKEGHIAILDGIHRIHHSTISILHRLVHDREVQLYDGRRLIQHDKYDGLIASGSTTEQLDAKGIQRIHPSFRIIALAEPPASIVNNQSSGTSTNNPTNWLSPEILSLFMFHEIRNLHKAEEIEIIRALYNDAVDFTNLDKILDLSHFLKGSKDPILKNLSGTLSTRQILRIAKRISNYDSDAYDIIQRVFLSKFLPSLPRQALEKSLDKFSIFESPEFENERQNVLITRDEQRLRIGKTEINLFKTDSLTKVPDILFYDVPQHIGLLENLLQDFLMGNHLLLIGNQGVGKNKLTDRLLQLMNRPREYIQLHRDTTVQTLTLQPNIKDGIVIYEDSPLVKAVKFGNVLVIDEADKAPTHVTCILKTLVENGEMTLSDGRKILPFTSPIESSDTIIKTHRNFRMIVLANRPGFPFLGNDFFASLGDLFSCHSIDNPSLDSEIYLLKQYGPNVPIDIIKKLVKSFGELRTMADLGQLSYPYSTREVVNIVKHLEKFPNEDMVELVGNVLDFDRYTPEMLEMVTNILQKHGLPIEAYAKNELSLIRRQKEIQLTVERKSGLNVSNPKHGKEDPKNDPHVGGNTWAGGTGGRDTAGLGGKGGPYRLDKGHKVHQLSDAEKDDIPDDVKKAAREMNRQAFEKKLKEIQMSEYDHKVYEEFSLPVRKQVQELRVIINSLQAKSKERHWQKHQTSGELDDTKLIEGITGERNIYRRRADQDPEPGQPQEKPKRLKLVVDVSGSMYRFNGYDGRLDRQLEAVVLVMESFQGFESKLVYDIVGHSGETYHIPFIDPKKYPADDKQRLDTIKMMHAHSQFCWSGDHTLIAAEHAVDSIAQEECDEAIVIVLSDANLERYGIAPKKLANALTKQEPKVQAYVIFIGSLGEEAQAIDSSMPFGRSFVCMDLAKLPSILKQIFSSSVLRNVN